jgi:site-specific recombinase XerD
MDSQNSFSSTINNFKDSLSKAGRASATILAYTKDIEQLADFLSKFQKSAPKEVLASDIDAFKDDLNRNGYTAKSVSRKLNSIKAFYRFLKTQGMVEDNPASGVSHPKYELKPPRVLSKLE